MTLLLALMGNEIIKNMTGVEFINPIWIGLIWGLHLAYYERKK